LHTTLDVIAYRPNFLIGGYLRIMKEPVIFTQTRNIGVPVTAYVSFGFLSDTFGRKLCYIAYLFMAALLVFAYGFIHTPWALVALGPLLAFFGTGYFSGFATVTAELYDTHSCYRTGLHLQRRSNCERWRRHSRLGTWRRSMASASHLRFLASLFCWAHCAGCGFLRQRE